MGFFSSIGLGGSSDLGQTSAEQIEIFNREAIARGDTDFSVTEGEIGDQQDQLREDFLSQIGINEAGFQPFIEAGEQGLSFLREGSTAEGFNKFLSEVMGGDLFQSLRDEQVKGARGQLAASGQTGSGLALEELSRISPQLALQLEGELFGRNRNLANMGFQGVERRGALNSNLIGNLGSLTNQNLSLEAQLRDKVSGRAQGFISGIGGAKSSGILADEQIDTQRFNNLLNLGSTIASF